MDVGRQRLWPDVGGAEIGRDRFRHGRNGDCGFWCSGQCLATGLGEREGGVASKLLACFVVVEYESLGSLADPHSESREGGVPVLALLQTGDGDIGKFDPHFDIHLGIFAGWCGGLQCVSMCEGSIGKGEDL